MPEAPAIGAPAVPVRAEHAGVVLLIDDEPLLLRALERILRPEGWELRSACTLAEAGPALADPALDIVLLDLRLGSENGLDILELVKREQPEVEVVMMTGHATIESAVRCMRQGAFDYLEKPFEDIHRVRNTVRKAIERRLLVRRNRELEDELREREGTTDLVGTSAPMRALVRKIESLRHNESNVLVTGESGTGKEMVAAALHARSGRRGHPFVAVDCGALPETVIESELFGHEKGAFTGAVGAPGLFRMADGGTLFLDEIGEIPGHLQAKLLRVLQQREVRPVGATRTQPVDLRLIAATNRDLDAMVHGGGFRNDLYYRLNVVRLEVPPLRARAGDVPLLARHFLEKHRAPDSPVRGFEPEALARLGTYPWPGNVRELENVIESALALATGELLRTFDLSIARGAPASAAAAPAGLPLRLEAYERCALERALEECGGDATRAARLLGIGRSTFYRKLQRHAIGRPVSRGEREDGLAEPRVAVGAHRSIG